MLFFKIFYQFRSTAENQIRKCIKEVTEQLEKIFYCSYPGSCLWGFWRWVWARRNAAVNMGSEAITLISTNVGWVFPSRGTVRMLSFRLLDNTALVIDWAGIRSYKNEHKLLKATEMLEYHTKWRNFAGDDATCAILTAMKRAFSLELVVIKGNRGEGACRRIRACGGENVNVLGSGEITPLGIANLMQNNYGHTPVTWVP